ncbi:unnamed protein product [Auanema sp. JU1783]|nr:unnamed protein product [Auanema sp. JU1783]
MRQKLDNRIRTLIENGVQTGHRTFFAIVGEHVKNQIPILHHILSKAHVKARPSVLWCYKSKLEFSCSRKKRMHDLKRKQAIGSSMVNAEDHFESFIASTNVRYCYYKETHKILGNTYGMLVLQDFEALTPNLLARTIETIEGGGVIVLLLKSVSSLRQLYTLSMDVHNRYRTEAHTDITPRFNERFILSLASSNSIAVLDEGFNILPISSHISKVEPLPFKKDKTTAAEHELNDMKEALKDTKPIGSLLGQCRTACQGKALLRLLDVITEKDLNVTCSVMAARGRGKSAALGLALAGAIAFGYTNIFVTSPSPENLRTFFEFVVKGFDTLQYQEHTDYELVQSTNPEFNKALVRINIFKEHRQIIQYIHPTDAVKLGQAELLVVDEAAAIPLPLVKNLISGPYIVFLASTINGYEGTGRSLSLKLLQQLREQSSGALKKDKGITSKGRKLHEMTMEESIRYKPGDEIEKWLNRVLCLDACNSAQRLSAGTPSPADCELFYVNRDTLFSFHKASEAFLQQIMSIYVSAHYKNSPNDLQMLSDAPAHHLFVLMAPIKEEDTEIPDVLAVIQVCFEGNLSKDTVSSSLERGKRAAGDLLPWTLSQQFLDDEFPTLFGGRIVRIAVHSDYQSMGYGSRALGLLEDYFLGNIVSLNESTRTFNKQKEKVKIVKNAEVVALLEEQIAPRAGLPPLLMRLDERPAEQLDYLGVSFGLTLNLLKFWKKASYTPVYMRQIANDLTGEHTCIVLKNIRPEESSNWLTFYWREFRTRMLNLYSYEFRKFSSQLAISLLQSRNKDIDTEDKNEPLDRHDISLFLSNTDMKRLAQYARNMIDPHLVTDLLPVVAHIYFNKKLSAETKLGPVQAAILLGMGLQHKSIENLAEELDLPVNQASALHNKTIRKLSDAIDEVCKNAIKKSIANFEEGAAEKLGTTFKPLEQSLKNELDDMKAEIQERQERDKKIAMVELSKHLQQYEISSDQTELENAYKNANMKFSAGNQSTFAVKSKRKTVKVQVPDEKNPLAGRKAKKPRDSF